MPFLYARQLDQHYTSANIQHTMPLYVYHERNSPPKQAQSPIVAVRTPACCVLKPSKRVVTAALTLLKGTLKSHCAHMLCRSALSSNGISEGYAPYRDALWLSAHHACSPHQPYLRLQLQDQALSCLQCKQLDLHVNLEGSAQAPPLAIGANVLHQSTLLPLASRLCFS